MAILACSGTVQHMAVVKPVKPKCWCGCVCLSADWFGVAEMVLGMGYVNVSAGVCSCLPLSMNTYCNCTVYIVHVERCECL